MCLFTWLGIRCTSPFPGVLKIQLDCVHSKKNNLTKPELVWRKPLKIIHQIIHLMYTF